MEKRMMTESKPRQKIRNQGIGSNIARCREAAGMKQGQVVIQMQLYGSKISRTSYSKLEAGRRHIMPEELMILAKIFQVDVQDFFQNIDIEKLYTAH